nr:ribonuclease H-like domain-containing protein [Tanacetum cinerariifolium]
MDTGASSHLTDNAGILISFSNSSMYTSVFVGNGHFIPVTHTEHSFLHTPSKPLHLNHILVTPHIIKNLILVRQFTRDNDFSVEFDAYGFSIKDYQTGRLLLRCDSTGDLNPVTQQPSSQTPVVLLSFSSTTWHRRLGHPGDDVLRRLEPRNLISCRKSKLHALCHACQLASNKIVILRHVWFDEDVFPFGNVTSSNQPTYDFLLPLMQTTTNVPTTKPFVQHMDEPNNPITPHPTTPPTTPPQPDTPLYHSSTPISPQPDTHPSHSSTPIITLAKTQSHAKMVDSHTPIPINDSSQTMPTHHMVTHAKAGIFKPLERMNCHVTTTSPLPRSHVHALRDPNWKEAMLDEYNALITNGTYNALLVSMDGANNSGLCMGLSKPRVLGFSALLVMLHESVFSIVKLTPLYLSFIEDLTLLICCFMWKILFLQHHLQHFYNGSLLSSTQICLYMHDPRDPYFTALKRILRYVRETIDHGLQLHVSSTSQLIAYTYVDWVGCPVTRRSTFGYCVFFGDNLLSWSAKRQVTLSRFSAEAEYRGVANAVVETAWIRNLLLELHAHLSTATLVYCDNYADIFTKGLPTALFLEFRFSLNVRIPLAQTAGGISCYRVRD